MPTTEEAFSGGVAVITGAGSGIGEALAKLCARLDMRVVVADVVEERLTAVATDLEAIGAQVLAVRTDVGVPADIDALADATHARFGDVTLLCNNAGIETIGFCWDLSAEDWERILRININGVIHGARAFAPDMIKAGKPAWIANTASIAALSMMPAQTPYILSKHAVLSFSECLSMEIQASGAPISVSAVLPGPVATRVFSDAPIAEKPMNSQHKAIMEQMVGEGMPAERAAETILEQIAAGNFWVSTHPEMTAEFAKMRAEHLTHLSSPVLGEKTRALLGTKE